MSKWNGNKFSVYESEEKSVLGLLDELGSQVNHNTDDLKNKTDLHGDHKGSWQGLSRPTMSEEGMRATVEDIIDNKIPSIQSSLETIDNELESTAINAQFPPNGYIGIKADNISDDTEALQFLLNTFKKVILPSKEIKISQMIELKDNTYLDLNGATLNFTNINSNVFKINNYCTLKNGKIKTLVGWGGNAIYHTNISTYNTIKDIVFDGDTSAGVEIASGTLIYFDNTSVSANGSNSYQMFNTYDNITGDWYGCGIKMKTNASMTPWCNANTFTNFRLWHVSRIVDVDKGFDGNIFNSFQTQTGVEDTLLYKVGGALNKFSDIIYFDLTNNTNIVEFTNTSRTNVFELWFKGGGGNTTPKYIDKGNKNIVTSLGGFFSNTTDITLTSPWVADTSADYCTPQIYTDNKYMAFLRGAIKGGGNNTLIATLPKGAGKITFFTCATNSGTALLKLHYNNLYCITMTGTTLFLDGIYYRTDV